MRFTNVGSRRYGRHVDDDAVKRLVGMLRPGATRQHLLRYLMSIGIDGSDVSGVTIDGETVQEITIDGNVVWSSQNLSQVQLDEYNADDVNSSGSVSMNGSTLSASNQQNYPSVS